MAFNIKDGLNVGTVSVVDTAGSIDYARLKNVSVPIANGGTGASTASVALSNLGGLDKSGGTMTGSLTLNADPSASLHAATKQYVDTIKQTTDQKDSVKAATTANISLTGLQTIDGVTLSAGDRVLVKNQTTATQNGIYVAASGAWTRSTDADTNAKVTGGLFVLVESGTTQAKTGWVLGIVGGATLGTTNLTFQQIAGPFVSNVSQLNNDSGYLTPNISTTISCAANSINDVGQLRFQSYGPSYGLGFDGGNGWRVFEGPDDFLYSSGAGSIQFTTGVDRRAAIDANGGIEAVGKFMTAAGTAVAPTYTFTGDTNTGMYSSAADNISFTTGGSVAMTIDSGNNLKVNGSLSIGIAPSSNTGIYVSKSFGGNNTYYGSLTTSTINNSEALTTNRSWYGAYNRNIVDLQSANKGAYTAASYGAYNVSWLATTLGNPAAVDYSYGSFNYVYNSAGSGFLNDARAAHNQVAHINALGATVSTGAYNYVLCGSTFTGTLGTAYGTYNRLDRDAGTMSKAYGVYNSFEGTIARKIGVFNTGAADLDLAVASVDSITIGHYNTGTDAVTVRLTVDTAGNFLVGKTDNSTTTAGGQMYSGRWNSVAATGVVAAFYNSSVSGTQVGSISTTTTATSYATSSDYRLKTELFPMSDAVKKVMSLNPGYHGWLKDPSVGLVPGWYAHEVQEVVPTAVVGDKDAVDESGTPVYQSVDNSKLVPLLAAALQDALRRIEALEAKLSN